MPCMWIIFMPVCFSMLVHSRHIFVSPMPCIAHFTELPRERKEKKRKYAIFWKAHAVFHSQFPHVTTNYTHIPVLCMDIWMESPPDFMALPYHLFLKGKDSSDLGFVLPVLKNYRRFLPTPYDHFGVDDPLDDEIISSVSRAVLHHCHSHFYCSRNACFLFGD